MEAFLIVYSFFYSFPFCALSHFPYFYKMKCNKDFTLISKAQFPAPLRASLTPVLHLCKILLVILYICLCIPCTNKPSKRQRWMFCHIWRAINMCMDSEFKDPAEDSIPLGETPYPIYYLSSDNGIITSVVIPVCHTTHVYH